jgi:hypothetical protein
MRRWQDNTLSVVSIKTIGGEQECHKETEQAREGKGPVQEKEWEEAVEDGAAGVEVVPG